MFTRSNYGLGACTVDADGNFACTGDLSVDASGIPVGGTNVGAGSMVFTSPYIPPASVAAPVSSSSINPLYLIGGGLGVILLISLLGGRRR